MEAELESLELITTRSLNDLKGKTIGIDASHLWNSISAEDPFRPAIGGFSKHIESALSIKLGALSAVSAKIVLVFNGIEAEEQKSAKPDQFWSSYITGVPSESRPVEKYLPYVFRLGQRLGAECYYAPYAAKAQLAYFLNENFIEYIYSEVDQLVYSPNVITDFTTDSFKIIERDTVLQRLNITQELLTQVITLHGIRLNMGKPMATIQQFIEGLRGSNLERYLDISTHRDAYIKMKNRYLDQLVFRYDTVDVDFLTRPFYPGAYGRRLFKDIYLALFLGVVSRSTISLLLDREIIVEYPTADSYLLRECHKKILNITKRSFLLMVDKMSTDVKSKALDIKYWHQVSANTSIAYEARTFLHWTFPTDLPEVPTMSFCLKQHYDSVGLGTLPSASLLSTEEEPVVNTVPDLLCRVHSKTLEHIEYINEVGKPTLFGKCALTFSAKQFDEGLMLMYLLKLGYLHKGEMKQADLKILSDEQFTSQMSLGKTGDEEVVMLVSRIFSLIPARTDAAPWPHEADLDLAMFHEIIRAIAAQICTLQESIIMSEMLSRKVVNPNVLLEASKHVSYMPDMNMGTGLAVKLLLTGLRISEVKEALPTCTNIERDLSKGYEFWKTMRSMHDVMKRYKQWKAPIEKLYVKATQILEKVLQDNSII